jgi:drug/metabolite transporter (DMT)-like permease
VIAAVLAAASAVSFGVGDFLGGLSAARWTAVRATAAAQTAGIPLLLLGVAFVDAPSVAATDLWWGLAGGTAGIVGIGSYYHALSVGTMSVTAPLAAVTSALVPLATGLATGERPGATPLAGAVLGVVAVALLSVPAGEHATRIDRRALGWALLAGLGLGGFYALLGQASSGSGLWPLVPERLLAALLLVPLATRARFAGAGRPGGLTLGAAAGVADMGGNICFLLAAQRGLLSLVGVISAMYPATTMVLARLLLRERLVRVQVVGAALALVAVGLIAVR